MKKALFYALLLIIVITSTVSCTFGNKNQAEATEGSSDDAPQSTLLDADKVLSFTKDADSLQIRVSLPECAGENISLILITDPSYQYSWEDEPATKLIDMGQLSLDQSGAGNGVLKLKSENEKCYLCLTSSAGSCIVEVK